MTSPKTGNRYVTEAWLDVREDHPALYGDVLLLRDDDGMGFALHLDHWRGAHVRITIERVRPKTERRLWPVPAAEAP